MHVSVLNWKPVILCFSHRQVLLVLRFISDYIYLNLETEYSCKMYFVFCLFFRLECILLLYFVLKFIAWCCVTVLDASGKLPPGVLKGNFQWLGNYRECRSHSYGFGTHYCPVAVGTQSSPDVCLSLFLVILGVLWHMFHYILWTSHKCGSFFKVTVVPILSAGLILANYHL